MAEHPWCRLSILLADGTVVRTWVLDGPGPPEIGAIDDVAHLALAAARRRERAIVRDLAPGMGELLRLAALPIDAASPIEVERQAELGEQAFGVEEVEEEGHLGDLPA